MTTSKQPQLFPSDLTCPVCHRTRPLDEFACGGACDGCVFCLGCLCEFDVETGKRHECTAACGRTGTLDDL